MESRMKSIVIIGVVILVAVIALHSCKKLEITQKSSDDQASLSVKMDKHKRSEKDDRRD